MRWVSSYFFCSQQPLCPILNFGNDKQLSLIPCPASVQVYPCLEHQIMAVAGSSRTLPRSALPFLHFQWATAGAGMMMMMMMMMMMI